MTERVESESQPQQVLKDTNQFYVILTQTSLRELIYSHTHTPPPEKLQQTAQFLWKVTQYKYDTCPKGESHMF